MKFLLWLLPALLLGCATTPSPTEHGNASLSTSAWAVASQAPHATDVWRHQAFQGRKATVYTPVKHRDRYALHAFSSSGSSLVRRPLNLSGDAIGMLHFSWFVPRLNEAFDLTDREAEDAVARVILTFDGDRQRFSARDRMLSELALLLTGEPLPYATLMYVWDHRHPVGTILEHPTTRRIRMMVVQSGPDRIGQWTELQRDVRADFEQAFGEPPQTLSGLGLMTDGNNTRQTVEAWYGPIRLEALPEIVAARQ